MKINLQQKIRGQQLLTSMNFILKQNTGKVLTANLFIYDTLVHIQIGAKILLLLWLYFDLHILQVIVENIIRRQQYE